MTKSKKKAARNARMRCKSHRGNGVQCKLLASPSSDYCFWHDPKRARERKEAQRLGGSRGLLATLPKETPPAEVASADDVLRILGETINHVRRGELHPTVANSIGYLANIILKAKEQADIEDRLKELERVVLKDGKVTKIRTSALPA